jgi:hypothetical protein
MTVTARSFLFSADFGDARLRGIVLILSAAVAIMAPGAADAQ